MAQAQTMNDGVNLSFALKDGENKLGAEVIGLDLTKPIEDACFAKLEDAFNNCSVLVFRNQKITPEQHIDFSRRFGGLAVHVMEQYLLPGYPEIFRVSNVIEDGKRIGGSGEFWHTDLSYVEQPSRGSLLYAVEVPRDANGRSLGDTVFANMAEAYNGLSDTTKKKIDNLKAVHRYGDVYKKVLKDRGGTVELNDDQKKKVPDVIHPVVHIHPFTKQKSLFVNEGFTAEIVGMPKDESDELLNELFEHCRRSEFHYRHVWEENDLVMWDNWATQHRGTGGYTSDHRRMMYRTTLEPTVQF